jgi:hypothetical protein
LKESGAMTIFIWQFLLGTQDLCVGTASLH